jgi:hypothetical protein
MTNRTLNEAEQRQLYGSLLRGIANVAQDRLCAADQQHVWGRWIRYVVEKDLPLVPLSAEPIAHDEAYRVAERRVCLNCGREDFSQ